jgi:peptidylprolyl isomerase
MKPIALILTLAAFVAAASAQTASKSSTPGTPKTATASASKSSTAVSTPEPWIKLPPGVPRIAHGPVRTPFALRYEDIRVGTGPEAESGKLWHLKYTGWRAADGVEFDSWDQHRMPAIKDGKPELGPDGKPKMNDPEPIAIPQGVGRVIPGFDWGLAGMKIGGKRRIFIPWQLAYGTRTIPDRPDHPGIPAKSDLIFDVELVDVTDLPQQRPFMPVTPPHPGANTQPNAAPGHPEAPTTPAAPAKPAAPAQQTPPQPQTQPK